MKIMHKTLIIALLAFLFISCQAEENKDSVDSHSEHSESMPDETEKKEFDRKELSMDVKSQLREVYRRNDKLYDLFVKEKYAQVEKQAKEVAEAIEKIDNKEVTQLLNFTKKNLNDLEGELDVEVLHEAYSMISTALIHVLKTYDIGPGYNAYFCPMVKKHWIQNSMQVTEVQNPYDKSMRKCCDKETKF
jgi:Spy/CpxP family protein refolding chaperone